MWGAEREKESIHFLKCEEYHRLHGKRTGANASRLCTGLQFPGLPHATDPLADRHPR